MADYILACTGAQIDDAVEKALNPDASPTSGSTNLAESGGVADGLAGKAALGSDGKISITQDSLAVANKTASFTLSASDAMHKFFRITANTVTVTLPANVFPAGTIIPFGVTGGSLRFVAGSGAYLKLVGGKSTASPHGSACAVALSSNEWLVAGCDS